METMGIIWGDTHPEIVKAFNRLAGKRGVSSEIPSWLPFVPEGKQIEAVRNHVDNLVAREERRTQVDQQRALAKSGRKLVIDSIAKHGYDLTYMECVGYIVALAFKASGKPNEVYVYFAVCSRSERDVWSKEFARELLLTRITSDDEQHSFACLVQGQGSMDKPLKSVFVKRRFLEYGIVTSKGLPHELAKLLRLGAGQYSFKQGGRRKAMSKGRHGTLKERVHNF